MALLCALSIVVGVIIIQNWQIVISVMGMVITTVLTMRGLSHKERLSRKADESRHEARHQDTERQLAVMNKSIEEVCENKKRSDFYSQEHRAEVKNELKEFRALISQREDRIMDKMDEVKESMNKLTAKIG